MVFLDLEGGREGGREGGVREREREEKESAFTNASGSQGSTGCCPTAGQSASFRTVLGRLHQGRRLREPRGTVCVCVSEYVCVHVCMRERSILKTCSGTSYVQGTKARYVI